VQQEETQRFLQIVSSYSGDSCGARTGRQEAVFFVATYFANTIDNDNKKETTIMGHCYAPSTGYTQPHYPAKDFLMWLSPKPRPG